MSIFGRKRHEGLVVEGVPIPLPDETVHFGVSGRVGGRRGDVIEAIVRYVTVVRRERVVLADIGSTRDDPGFDAARGDVMLDVWRDTGVMWDPLEECESGADVAWLTETLWGAGDGDESSKYRQVFRCLLEQLWELRREMPEVATVTELCRVLLHGNTRELRQLLRGTAAEGLVNAGQAWDVLRRPMVRRLQLLQKMAGRGGRPFSIEGWIHDGGGRSSVLWLPFSVYDQSEASLLTAAWMRWAMLEATRRSEPQERLWFVVSDVAELARIEGLASLLSQLRKKRATVVLGLSPERSLEFKYGFEAKPIQAACGNWVDLEGGLLKVASRAKAVRIGA